jgi:transposase
MDPSGAVAAGPDPVSRWAVGGSPHGAQRDVLADPLWSRGAGRMTRNRAASPTRRAGSRRAGRVGRAGKPSAGPGAGRRARFTWPLTTVPADLAGHQCRAASRQPRATAGAGRDPDPPPRTRPAPDPTRPGCWATRPTPAARSAPTCVNAGSRRPSPEPAAQKNNRLRRGSEDGRPPRFDREVDRQRKVVERAINKLKAHRAVVTRYDKRDYTFSGTIDLASIRVWLRDPVP